MADFNYSDELYSDLHKEAYGSRPGQFGMERWNSKAPHEKQAEWDSLIEQLEYNESQYLLAREQEVKEAEELLETLMSCGAPDLSTATRWVEEAAA